MRVTTTLIIYIEISKLSRNRAFILVDVGVSANLGDAEGSPAKHQGYKKRLMMGFLDVHQSLLKYVNTATYVGRV